MQQTTVTNGQTCLAVRERSGQGTPVVFVSGGPGMPDYLQGVAVSLEGRRVVTYDQRGTGQSTAPDGDFTVAAHISDLEALRCALGGEGMHLFGHSWGALLCLLFAAEHPSAVESLFLCSPSLGVGSDWARLEASAMRHHVRRSGSPLAAARMLVTASLGQLPGRFGEACMRTTYARAWSNFQRAGREVPASQELLDGIGQRCAVGVRASVLSLPKSTLDDALSATAMPKHILTGSEDFFGKTAQQLAQRFPTTSFELWEECGHLPWLDHPQRFGALLNDFYRGLK